MPSLDQTPLKVSLYFYCNNFERFMEMGHKDTLVLSPFIVSQEYGHFMRD